MYYYYYAYATIPPILLPLKHFYYLFEISKWWFHELFLIKVSTIIIYGALRDFFLQLHRAYQTWHEEKQTKSTKKVVYKDRTQWLIHFQYYTVHILFLSSNSTFVGEKKIFFFQIFFFGCVCVIISRIFLYNVDKILEK